MSNKPNKNICECVESIKALCDSIRYEASMLSKLAVDLEIVQDTIERRCDDIDEARRSIEYYSGISTARTETWERIKAATLDKITEKEKRG